MGSVIPCGLPASCARAAQTRACACRRVCACACRGVCWWRVCLFVCPLISMVCLFLGSFVCLFACLFVCLFVRVPFFVASVLRWLCAARVRPHHRHRLPGVRRVQRYQGRSSHERPHTHTHARTHTHTHTHAHSGRAAVHLVFRAGFACTRAGISVCVCVRLRVRGLHGAGVLVSVCLLVRARARVWRAVFNVAGQTRGRVRVEAHDVHLRIRMQKQNHKPTTNWF